MNIFFRDSKFISNYLFKVKLSTNKNIYKDTFNKNIKFNCLRTISVSTKFLNTDNLIFQNNNQIFYQNFKKFSSLNNIKMKALLIGVFEKKENDTKSLVLTEFAKKINEKTGGKLLNQLNVGGPVKHCKSRIFYNLLDEYPILAVVGLGPVDASFNPLEDLDELKENIRSGIGCGLNAIRDLDVNVDTIEIDGASDASAAAEGAYLARYYYDELKSEDLKKKPLNLKLADANSSNTESWLKGSVLAEFQNKCRDLMERPANLLTPTVFGETAKKLCEPLNVKVIVHDRKWAEEKKMGSFLSVSNGSDEPPKFVELHYNNAGQRKPIVFVGKGITFDSGGISLKPGSKMDEMRADMGGAANVLTTIACLAALKAKVNIIGLIPLTENLPSGKATKPGDVVYAMNGKSIQIDNTDAEGRLVLADALCYADSFDPELIVDIATLTGACIMALGQACTAVYSTNKNYWKMIRNSGYVTGDRVWKMPLYSAYSKKMKDTVLADLNNLCKDAGYGGGSATAAGFLKEFVKCENWMHLDMAGTMGCSDYKYMSRGMAGRPLRTLVDFFEKNFH